MKKTGPSLDWCIVRLGKDDKWWIDSISDKENWDADDLGIIDPKQFLHINELLDSMSEFGLDSQLVDDAFFTFEIKEEVKGFPYILVSFYANDIEFGEIYRFTAIEISDFKIKIE